MSQVELFFYHPDIQGVSDRTIKQFFKRLSKSLRASQINEISGFIDGLDFLEESEKQSLKDQIKQHKDTAPLYYLEDFTRGSANIRVLMGAFFIWLLQATIGQTLMEAWKETEIHKKIIEYVEEERPVKIYNDISDNFLIGQHLDVFVVENVTLHETLDEEGNKKFIIEVGVEAPSSDTRKVDSNVYDQEFILRHSRQSINRQA